VISSLHIRLLGGFQLSADDTPLPVHGQRRFQKLLAYLVLDRDAPQSRAHVAFVIWPDSTDATVAPCAWLYGVRLWQASFRFSYRYKATFGSGDTATTDAAAIFTTLLTADPGAAAPALDWHAPVGQAGQGFVTEHWQETQKGAVSAVDSGSDSPAYVPALGPRVESTVAYLHTDPQGCSYTLDFGAKLTRVTIQTDAHCFWQTGT